MSTDRRIRWTATSALAVSCFALGFSVWSVGCHERDPGAAATREQPATFHAAQALAAPRALAPVVEPAGNDVHADTAPAHDTSVDAPHATAPRESSPSPDGLDVKRLVVTRGVEHREPLSTDHLTAGAGPVFAFVELRNSSDDDKVVTVDFRHASDPSVGHIKLKVPAHSARWRTWGHTRMIKEGGEWTAVVRAGDGSELAHTTFNVEAAES